MTRQNLLGTGALLVALMGFAGEPGSAQETAACTVTLANTYCGLAVDTGNPDFPCKVRDGVNYCPVFETYRNVRIIV